MQNTLPPRFIFPMAACLLVSACSSAPDLGDDPDHTSMGGQGVALNEQAIFSDARELDYSPRAEDYHIGVADLLEISVFRADEFSRQARVDSDGGISLPLLDKVQAEGLTPTQLEQRIAGLLQQKYLQDPQVTVFIKEYSSQHITLDGSFRKPGVYPITAGQVNALQALALGDGLADLADPSKVVLFRKTDNNVKAYRLDIDAIRNGKVRNPYLRNNDIIVAHRSNSRYWLREVATSLGSIRTIFSPF